MFGKLTFPPQLFYSKINFPVPRFMLIFLLLTFERLRLLGVVCLLHNLCTFYTNTTDVDLNMARRMPVKFLPKCNVGMHHIFLQISTLSSVRNSLIFVKVSKKILKPHRICPLSSILPRGRNCYFSSHRNEFKFINFFPINKLFYFLFSSHNVIIFVSDHKTVKAFR